MPPPSLPSSRSTLLRIQKGKTRGRPSRARSPRRSPRSAGSDEEEGSEETAGITRQGCTIYFFASVTRETIHALLTKLSEANAHAAAQATPACSPGVTLYIQSEGGDAHAGLSGMDHIRTNLFPVTCVADGFVASAASFLLVAGAKKLCFQNATVLIHQISTGFEGKYNEMVDEVKNSSEVMRQMRRAYLSSTRMSEKQLDRLLKKEISLSSEQCVKLGVVEGVL